MITFLNGFVAVLKVIEVVAVTTILAIAIDFLFFDDKRCRNVKVEDQYKAQREAEKNKLRLIKELEAAATQSFFENGYVRGFDPNGSLIYRGARIPTQQAWEYYKLVDEFADSKIFEHTEVL